MLRKLLRTKIWYIWREVLPTAFLFLNGKGCDRILVESEGADYAHKSQFIPNARAIVEQSEFTAEERQLHAELKGMANRIAELAHMGEKTFSFDEMLGNGNMKANDDSGCGWNAQQTWRYRTGKSSFSWNFGTARFLSHRQAHTEDETLLSPWIHAEPQYEEDGDFDYDNYEIIPSNCAGGLTKEINATIQKYVEPEEIYCGLMAYYNEDSPLCKKVVSSVDVRNGNLL